MGNSTAQLDQISSTQSNKELLINSLNDALSPSSLFGRHASATSGLTWGYYGGTFGSNAVANGTVTLTASATNYVQANGTTGAVSANTTGFTAGSVALYTVVTGATSVTSYTDNRSLYTPASSGPSGMGLAGGAVQTAAYTWAAADKGQVLAMNSASAVTQPLPAPGSTFAAGFWGGVDNIGAGATTLTVPSGVQLDGVTNGTVTLGQRSGLLFFTDGTNLFTIRGGASALAALSDVAVSAPANNQALLYSSATSKWTNTTLGGASFSPFTLASMSSGTLYQPPGGYTPGTQVIIKNGSVLTPGSGNDYTATDGTNINFAVAVKSADTLLRITLPAIGGVSGSPTLSGLSDVAVSGPTNGQVLTYSALTGKWTNQAGGGGAGAIGMTSGTGVPTASATVGDIYRATDGAVGRRLFQYTGSYSGLPVVVNTGVANAPAAGGMISVTMERATTPGNLLVAIGFGGGSAVPITAGSGWTSIYSNASPTIIGNAVWSTVGSASTTVSPGTRPSTGSSDGMILVVEVANAASSTPVRGGVLYSSTGATYTAAAGSLILDTFAGNAGYTRSAKPPGSTFLGQINSSTSGYILSGRAMPLVAGILPQSLYPEYALSAGGSQGIVEIAAGAASVNYWATMD